MKYAIIGGRDFNDTALLETTMNKFNDITLVVSGGAKGADTLGEHWAKSHNIPTKIHYPEWNKYGKSAGFIRNKLIIQDADIIIAFWNGHSRGTANSIDIAKTSNKPIIIIGY